MRSPFVAKLRTVSDRAAHVRSEPRGALRCGRHRSSADSLPISADIGGCRPAIVLIIVSANPQSLMGRFWGMPALVWIGARSYGMYLWHGPVLMLTRSGDDVNMWGAPLATIQIMLVVGISALSYRFVEQPIRRNGLTGLRRAFSTLHGKWREHPAQTIAAWTGCVAVIALIALVVLVPESSQLMPWQRH